MIAHPAWPPYNARAFSGDAVNTPVATIDDAAVRRQGWRVVAGQMLVTLVVMALCYVWKGVPGATWALVGGGIGAAATLAQVLVALRSAAGKEPKEVVRGFYRGSAVKFVVTVVLFVWALRGRQVLGAPMFAGYVATFLVYWVALARSLAPPQR